MTPGEQRILVGATIAALAFSAAAVLVRDMDIWLLLVEMILGLLLLVWLQLLFMVIGRNSDGQ